MSDDEVVTKEVSDIVKGHCFKKKIVSRETLDLMKSEASKITIEDLVKFRSKRNIKLKKHTTNVGSV